MEKRRLQQLTYHLERLLNKAERDLLTCRLCDREGYETKAMYISHELGMLREFGGNV